jgi:hypothetical protein
MNLPGRNMLKRFAILGAFALAAVPAAAATYDARYRAEVKPEAGTIHIELKLSGEKLPSRVELHIDPKRHRNFTSTDKLDIAERTVTWRPSGKFSRLNYEFVVNHERSQGRYDSLLTKDWALFRADKMVPRISATAVRGLESHATLEFVLPNEWTAVSAYAEDNPNQKAGTLRIDDPTRRFDRPEGWMLTGKLGKRSELVGGVQTIVAAPAGDTARRQDMLSFLNWNLPHLLNVFPDFPKRVLVTSAGDPMWRGGLSGPSSLFIHADRPLISENRTSTLLHELVHVAMGIRADEESDWIVEGFAEYYSIETLRRSGGIGKQRYEEALRRLQQWGKRSPNLFDSQSSGATTARAVIALKLVDDEIRLATSGRASLDDVARELAHRGGTVDLQTLQSIAHKVAGQPLKSLERKVLMNP